MLDFFGASLQALRTVQLIPRLPIKLRMNSIPLPEIYSYKCYKKYILDYVKAQPQRGRGFFSKVAKSLESQSSFISQVFSGNLNLTQDQAFKLCTFLELDNESISYFLLLVDLKRTGSKALKNHIEKEIARRQELAFKARVQGKNSLVLSDEEQQIYYSTWHYSVIHIALSIPKYHDLDLLSSILGLEVKVINRVVNFLISKDLIRLTHDGKYELGERKIHLNWNSKHLAKHHSNFRLLAINAIDKGISMDNIHYSSVISISKEDALELRDQLSSQISKVREKVRISEPTEELYCFNLDFFKFGES